MAVESSTSAFTFSGTGGSPGISRSPSRRAMRARPARRPSNFRSQDVQRDAALAFRHRSIDALRSFVHLGRGLRVDGGDHLRAIAAVMTRLSARGGFPALGVAARPLCAIASFSLPGRATPARSGPRTTAIAAPPPPAGRTTPRASRRNGEAGASGRRARNRAAPAGQGGVGHPVRLCPNRRRRRAWPGPRFALRRARLGQVVAGSDLGLMGGDGAAELALEGRRRPECRAQNASSACSACASSVSAPSASPISPCARISWRPA